MFLVNWKIQFNEQHPEAPFQKINNIVKNAQFQLIYYTLFKIVDQFALVYFVALWNHDPVIKSNHVLVETENSVVGKETEIRGRMKLTDGWIFW